MRWLDHSEPCIPSDPESVPSFPNKMEGSCAKIAIARWSHRKKAWRKEDGPTKMSWCAKDMLLASTQTKIFLGVLRINSVYGVQVLHSAP